MLQTPNFSYFCLRQAMPEGLFQWIRLIMDAVTVAVTVIVCAVPEGLPMLTSMLLSAQSLKMEKDNVLVKKINGMETSGSLSILFSDKTGTITRGEPEVTKILPAEGVLEEELLKLAASLESRSEHPLAKAIMAKAVNVDLCEVSEFTALPGNGLSAKISVDGQKELLVGGSHKFIGSQVALSKDVDLQVESLSNAGATPLLFVQGKRFLGIIAVADQVKPDSATAVSTAGI